MSVTCVGVSVCGVTCVGVSVGGVTCVGVSVWGVCGCSGICTLSRFEMDLIFHPLKWQANWVHNVLTLLFQGHILFKLQTRTHPIKHNIIATNIKIPSLRILLPTPMLGKRKEPS